MQFQQHFWHTFSWLFCSWATLRESRWEEERFLSHSCSSSWTEVSEITDNELDWWRHFSASVWPHWPPPSSSFPLSRGFSLHWASKIPGSHLAWATLWNVTSVFGLWTRYNSDWVWCNKCTFNLIYQDHNANETNVTKNEGFISEIIRILIPFR